jgi:hypothetical protein
VLLQDGTQIQPLLGTWGTLFSFLLSVVLAFIAWRATVRAKTAEAWESTARAAQSAEVAAKSEMQTWKDAAARREREKLELAEEVGRLRAATDLSILTKANQEEHQLIVTTLAAVQGALSAVHAGLQDNTKAMRGFQSQVAAAFETISERLRER